jgi:arylsulfatase A-like enzyme
VIVALCVLAFVGAATALLRETLGPEPRPDLHDAELLTEVTATLAADPDLPLDAAHTDVLLLNLCTVRKDRLGLYGNRHPTTPFLDELGQAGVVFETNLAQAPWTRPSMGALLTGRWPRALHLDDRDAFVRSARVLGQDHTTLAERLADAGYGAAGVAGNPHLDALYGFDQGFDHYSIPEGTGWKRGTATSRVIVDEALALAGRVPLDQRLYLQVNALDGHTPIADDFRYRHLMKRGPRGNRRVKYDSALRTMDRQLARLVLALKADRPNLLVVLATDHGEGLNLPKNHGHKHGKQVYRNTTETALVFQHPALPSPGRRVGGLSMNIDVVPTVLDLLGVPASDSWDGASQKPAVLGQEDRASHAIAFSETFFRKAHASTAMNDDYQLIRTYRPNGTVNDRLFRAKDADALREVSEAEPAAAARMSTALDAWEAEMLVLEQQGAPEDVPLGAGDQQLLEELGYMDADEGD